MNSKKKSNNEPDPWGGMSLGEVLSSNPNQRNQQRFSNNQQRTNQGARQQNQGSGLGRMGVSNQNRNNQYQQTPQERQIHPQVQQQQRGVNNFDEYDEFAQYEYEQELLGDRPDPSIKQDCRENIAVKFNPSGRYNLNFIDWENEWEAIFDRYQNYNTNFESPIDGMDIQTFENLYDQFMDEELKQNGVREEILKKIPIKTVLKEDPHQMCAICIKVYEKKQKVFYLPCKHNFHIECIKPWFEKNHICPNCRFNINENQHQQEQKSS